MQYLIITIVFAVFFSLIVIFHFEAFHSVKKKSNILLGQLEQEIYSEKQRTTELHKKEDEVFMEDDFFKIPFQKLHITIAELNFSFSEIFKGL